MSDLLKRIRLDFNDLARLSGVSHGYIRLLSSRNRMAGPDTRAKLAGALRQHAATLVTEAERLERADDLDA